jgi:Zn-dependent M28 family amino/carboxypeptidase
MKKAVEESGGPPLIHSSDEELALYLRNHVYTLAGTIGERNTERYDKLIEAQEFLIRALQNRGYRPRLQTYTVDDKDCSNIEVEQIGTEFPEKIIVVGAHYDSIRGGPGANDNASGVAGVLALASLLKGQSLKKTIRFLCFVNEEPPYTRTSEMGSLIYAEACKARKEHIEVMFSLETIGYFPLKAKQREVEPWLYQLISPSDKGFIAFISNLSSRSLLEEMKNLFRQRTDFPVKSLALPGMLPGVKASDHWSFWKQGYEAVMVTDTAWARYPFYHTREDTPEKLDYCKMAKLLRGLEGILVGLGNSSISAL